MYRDKLKRGGVKMKNIRIKRMILILLSILTIFSSTIVCYAAVINDDAIPCYTYISYYVAALDISGIKSECTASIRANQVVNLTIKMELQKEKSSGYETVETWTSSKTGTFLAMSESRNINVLCDYRLKVTFTAGTETEVIYKY